MGYHFQTSSHTHANAVCTYYHTSMTRGPLSEYIVYDFPKMCIMKWQQLDGMKMNHFIDYIRFLVITYSSPKIDENMSNIFISTILPLLIL